MKSKSKNSAKKSPQKNIKGNKKIQEKEEEEKKEEPPKEKPKNLERFIYISTYNDSNLMITLKKLFEEVNQKAFNLESPKEVYTRNLTDEEKDNNEIDYISGFQLIDKTLRITILEGITGQGMKKIKEYLPRMQLNTENLKIFSDSNILFDKRLYSNFGLSLKFIKLQKNLSEILQTYEIYEKAHRCREIYDSFQIFGSLINAETMREITLAKLFPEYEHLLLLERKYGDLITEQDMTGIYKEKKKTKRIRVKDLISSTSNSNSISSSKRISSLGNNSYNNSNILNNQISNNSNINNDNIKKMPKVHVSKSQININNKYISRNDMNEIINDDIINIHKLRFKQKTDSKNIAYANFLKEKKLKHVSKSQIWDNNLKHIENIKKKIPVVQRFCRPCPEGNEIIERPKEILYCPARNNYYDALTKNMREKYLKDKKHYYSFSNYSLALSFPMIERERNQKYLDYVENKSKWINDKDFERYKQPEKEKYYFPKINNVL